MPSSAAARPMAAAPAAAPRSALAIRGMTVAYGEKPVVFSVDADFPNAALSAIIGPNGAGKSSLIKAALGVIASVSGTVTVDGAPLAQARARIAYVPQRAAVDWEFPARAGDVVAMGLHHELGLLGRFRPTHRERVAAALQRVGMGAFADRQIGQLSGGQQQRVFLARALVQNASLFILDEPLAGVDAVTEAAIIHVLKGLAAEGKAVIAVHHDLSTVRAYFDHVLLMNVRKVAEGPAPAAFTEANLRETFGGRVGTPLPAPQP